ncbi:uncharacterized protein LOC116942964 [Petromyzon marinus]|uniref:uncharacterized protein LOC116942964 n=1 Tax=Petromyzon marinus TaxID=7757 RepID=UPI003F730A9A
MYESNASECHGADAEGCACNDAEAGRSPALAVGGSRDADADLTPTSINPFAACAPPAGASPSTRSLDETPPPANGAGEQARVSETHVVNTSGIGVSAGPAPPDRGNENGAREIPSRYKPPENAPRAGGAVEISFVEPGNDFVDLSERNAVAALSVDQLPTPIVIGCDLLLEAACQRATPTVQPDKLSLAERPPSSKNGDTVPDGAPAECKVSLEQRQGSVTLDVRPTNGSVRLGRWKSFRNSLGANSLSVESSIISDTESYILTLGRKASAWVSNETYVHDSQQQYNHHQQQQQQRGTASVPPAKKASPHKERFYRFGKTVLWVLFAIFLVALSPLIMIGYGIYAVINWIACPKERSNDTVT